MGSGDRKWRPVHSNRVPDIRNGMAMECLAAFGYHLHKDFDEIFVREKAERGF
jgi:hypothetical protein